MESINLLPENGENTLREIANVDKGALSEKDHSCVHSAVTNGGRDGN